MGGQSSTSARSRVPSPASPGNGNRNHRGDVRERNSGARQDQYAYNALSGQQARPEGMLVQNHVWTVVSDEESGLGASPSSHPSESRLKKDKSTPSSSSTFPVIEAISIPSLSSNTKVEAKSSTPVCLCVVIKGVRGLRNADTAPGQGLSDPYVVCQVIRPDSTKATSSSSRMQTPVARDTLEHEWNFEGILTDFQEGGSLLFEVWDKDVVKSDDFLGRARLEPSPSGFEGDLQLQDAGLHIEAYLTVRVAFAKNEAARLHKQGKQQQQEGLLDDALHSYAEAKKLFMSDGLMESEKGAELLEDVANVERLRHGFCVALQQLNEAKEIRQRTNTLRTPAGARLLTQVGSVCCALGDESGASEAYKLAKDIYRSTGSMETCEAAVMMMDLGSFYLLTGRSKEGLKALNHAKSLQEKTGMLATHARAVVGLLMNLATAQNLSGNPQDALETFGEARRLLDDHLKALASEDGAELLRNIAITHRQNGRPQAAMAILLEAKSLRKQIGLLVTPEGARLLANIGVAEAELGQTTSALESFEEARRIRAETGSLETSDGASLLHNIGTIQMQLGKFDTALSSLTEAKAIRTRTKTLETAFGIEIFRSLGNLYLQSDATLALEHLESAQRSYLRLESSKRPTPRSYVEVLRSIALARIKLGQIDAALKDLNEAQAVCTSANLLDSDIGAALLTHVGIARFEKKDYSASIKALNDAKSIYERLGMVGSVEEKALVETIAEASKHVPSTSAVASLKVSLASLPAREAAKKLSDFAFESGKAGDVTSAIEGYEEAVKLCESIRAGPGGLVDLEGARLLSSLGAAYGSCGQIDKAAEVLERALGILESLKLLDTSEEGAELLRNLGYAESLRGHSLREIACYEEARHILSRLNNLESSAGLRVLRCLGKAKQRDGDSVGALEDLELAYKIHVKMGTSESKSANELKEIITTLKEQSFQ